MGASTEESARLDSLAGTYGPPLSHLKDGSFGGGGGFLWKQFHLTGNVGLDSGNVTLLQRVDRLDNMISVMEDKVPGEQSSCASSSPRGSAQQPYACWSGPPTPSSLEKRCKSTVAVLEEVEEKGNLVERVSELEKRISKLQQIISTKSASADMGTMSSTAEENVQVRNVESAKGVEGGKCEVLAIVTTIKEHRSTRSEEGLNEEAMSDSGESSEHEQKTTPRQRLKTRSKRIKKWFSKRLHLPFPSAAANTAQVEAH